MHELWIKNNESKKVNQSFTFLDLSAAFDTLDSDIFARNSNVMVSIKSVQNGSGPTSQTEDKKS